MTGEAEVTGVRARGAASPRSIGRYRICFELAVGGMATVYLARLEGAGGFKKLVALKRIHPHLVGQEGFVEMFLDEARLASRIEHPNVCGVFDFGFGDESYYIAMEFLVGETVARLVGLMRQSPDVSPLPGHALYVARIIGDAALGLHAAHELRGDDGRHLGVVHRDVSPQNLMVTYDGVAKVMDFGIATATDQIHHTRTGTVRGKFAYMSPEQLDGRAVDRRADVWSLGVVTWELLTGRPLFSHLSEPEAVRAVLDAPIAAPSAVRAGIPGELDEIVRRCLARAPDDRWPTTQALAEVLSSVRTRRAMPVTATALGQWLRELFPDLYGRRLELLDQARQMQGEGVPRVSRMLSQPGVETRPIAAPGPVRPPPARARRRALVIGGAVALLGGSTLFLVPISLRSPPRPEPSSAPSSAAPGPPSAAATPPSESAALARKESADPRPAGEPLDAPRPAPPADRQAPTSAVVASNARPRPAAAPAAVGNVDVATPGGWADVYVSGRRQGRTPLRLALPAGKQTIALRPFGTGSSERHAVLVKEGALARLVVPIAPAPR